MRDIKTFLILLFMFLLIGCQNISNENENDVQEILLEKAEIAFKNLMNKDWADFAQQLHHDHGLVYSPFSNVGDIDDLHFSKNHVSSFGEDSSEYTWSWDQSGATFEDTPNGLVDHFLKTHQFDRTYDLEYELVTFNGSRIGSGGSQLNTIEDEYTDAKYVEYFHEPDEENYHLWQAIRLVYEEIDGEWYLVALVRGAHNP